MEIFAKVTFLGKLNQLRTTISFWLFELYRSHRLISLVMSAHLKQKSAVFLQTYTLPVGQCEQTVVIHYGVHVLYPQCIHVSVEYDVLSLILVCWFVDLSEEDRKSVV